MTNSELMFLARAASAKLCTSNGLEIPVRITNITQTRDEPTEFHLMETGMTSLHRRGISEPPKNPYAIKNVIFNAPATIVFWQDGTKTVVKANDEEYDPEKGLAMAMVKKMLGNKGNYFNAIKKWLPKETKKIDAPTNDPRPWRIWYRCFIGGKRVGCGVYTNEYQRKCDATRVARQKFGDPEKYEFIVSKTNPWSKEG